MIILISKVIFLFLTHNAMFLCVLIFLLCGDYFHWKIICEHYFRPRMNKSSFVLEVLKTTLRFDDSLQGFTEFRKTVILMEKGY